MQAESITSTTFNVTWSEPRIRNGDFVHIDQYFVQVFDYQASRTISSLNSTAQYYERQSLHPNYHYRIEISAITAANVFGPVTYHTVRTNEDGNVAKFNIICRIYLLWLFNFLFSSHWSTTEFVLLQCHKFVIHIDVG